jgi:hypothetical protein
MTWRDFLFDASTNLAIARPLTADAMARIPHGFRAWAGSRAAEPFRFARRPDGSGWRPVHDAELAAAIESSIVRVDDGLGLEGMLAVARDTAYLHFGVVLLLSSDSLAVSFSHRFADGVATLTALETILSGRPQAEPRMSGTPILRGLAHTGQLNLAGLRHGRDALRATNSLLARVPRAAAAQRPASDSATLSEFVLSSSRLSELAAAERSRTPSVDDDPRIPNSAVLAGLVFRAMRRGLADGADLPIGMLVGLRRHLGSGWSTRGNFATGIVAGTLRERDWSAADFHRVVTPRIASITPMASYAVETLARSRARLGATRRTPLSINPAGLMFSYNVLPGGIGLERDDYIAGATPRPGLIMLNRGDPLGPYCTTAATGREFVITTVDDSGSVDLAGLEAAFRAEEELLLG